MSTEPTTEAGRKLLAYLSPDVEALLAADPREEWVADAWGRYGGDVAAIEAIETEAREQGAREELAKRRERARMTAVSLGWTKETLEAILWLLADPAPPLGVREP